MKDVMIDMETLGVNKRAVLLDIALIQFDINTGQIGETMHMVCDRASQEAVGRTVDKSTIEWWDRQSEDARTIIDESEHSGVEWDTVLLTVQNFLKTIKGSIVWSNGANFDIAILEEAFLQANIVQPWTMWKTRCVRTLHDIVKEITHTAWKKDVQPPTVAHNSISDCEYQIRYCVEAYAQLKTSQLV